MVGGRLNVRKLRASPERFRRSRSKAMGIADLIIINKKYIYGK